jgi:hypothetical protein
MTWKDTNISEDHAASIWPEDGGSMVPWYSGILSYHYAVSQLRPLESSSLWEPQLLYHAIYAAL